MANLPGDGAPERRLSGGVGRKSGASGEKERLEAKEAAEEAGAAVVDKLHLFTVYRTHNLQQTRKRRREREGEERRREKTRSVDGERSM